MKHRIYYKREFSASHQLSLPYESKCKNLHGHNYITECWIEAEPDENGMVIDFSRLKSIIDELDHSHLNDKIPQPTAENIAEWILERIAQERPDAKIKVRVWEDRDSYAEVED